VIARLVTVTDAETVDTFCMTPRPVWSPDGRRYAYEGLHGIYVRAPGKDRVVTVQSGSWFRWSPSGASLTVSESGPGAGWRFLDVPLAGGTARRIGFVTTLSWRPPVAR
jgi:hypothetical protein